MKQVLSFLILSSLCLTLQGNRPPSAGKLTGAVETALIEYVWYNDVGLTDPTGSTGTVNSEIQRLRLIFTDVFFSATPGVGLLPFEWGVFSPTITVIIYSNW